MFLNLTKALQNHPGMVNDQTLKCWQEQEKKRVTASTWNMSQSGCINSARNRVLYATEAMWIVWDAGSRGQKSSDARINALFFELSHSVDVSNQTFNFDKKDCKTIYVEKGLNPYWTHNLNLDILQFMHVRIVIPPYHAGKLKNSQLRTGP
jgi:hypothetical protein